MKARRVKGLRPDGPLADNVERIARVRIAELWSFFPVVLDPEHVDALHDMRIAAKRLRYILEFSGHLFGPAARRGAKQAKALQDVLGEIHDCDVMLPRVRSHIDRLRVQDVAAVREQAPAAGLDLEPVAARSAPNRARYRGLEALGAYLGARREVLYERFVREWEELEAQQLRTTLEQALSERANAMPQNPR